jgi:hypothetical protein
MIEIVYITRLEPLEGQRICAMFQRRAVKDIDLGGLLREGGFGNGHVLG